MKLEIIVVVSFLGAPLLRSSPQGHCEPDNRRRSYDFFNLNLSKLLEAAKQIKNKIPAEIGCKPEIPNEFSISGGTYYTLDCCEGNETKLYGIKGSASVELFTFGCKAKVGKDNWPAKGELSIAVSSPLKVSIDSQESCDSSKVSGRLSLEGDLSINGELRVLCCDAIHGVASLTTNVGGAGEFKVDFSDDTWEAKTKAWINPATISAKVKFGELTNKNFSYQFFERIESEEVEAGGSL